MLSCLLRHIILIIIHFPKVHVAAPELFVMAELEAAELGSLIEELPELDFGDWLEAPGNPDTSVKRNPSPSTVLQVFISCKPVGNWRAKSFLKALAKACFLRIPISHFLECAALCSCRDCYLNGVPFVQLFSQNLHNKHTMPWSTNRHGQKHCNAMQGSSNDGYKQASNQQPVYLPSAQKTLYRSPFQELDIGARPAEKSFGHVIPAQKENVPKTFQTQAATALGVGSSMRRCKSQSQRSALSGGNSQNVHSAHTAKKATAASKAMPAWLKEKLDQLGDVPVLDTGNDSFSGLSSELTALSGGKPCAYTGRAVQLFSPSNQAASPQLPTLPGEDRCRGSRLPEVAMVKCTVAKRSTAMSSKALSISLPKAYKLIQQSSLSGNLQQSRGKAMQYNGKIWCVCIKSM